MRKNRKETLTPYKQTEYDYLVDRDIETEKLNKIIDEKVACAYILFSPTGIGKSSIALKFIRTINVETHGLPIRVKTTPKNSADGEDGSFLHSVFKESVKVIKMLPRCRKYKHLEFEYYITHCKDKALKRRLLENFIGHFYDTNNVKSTFLRMLTLYTLKRFLKLGEFNYINILRENTLDNRMVIADYLKYVFSRIRVILSADNLQNIDNDSLKFLLDWMNETKSQAPLFLLEYTLPENQSTKDMLLLIERIRETGIKTLYEHTSYLKSGDAVDALRQFCGEGLSVDFMREAGEYYISQANGNVRKLIDFHITYSQHQHLSNEGFDSTLENLLSLGKAEKQVIALLYLLDGQIEISLLSQIMVPALLVNATAFTDCIRCLEYQKDLVKREENTLIIQHASVLDAWEANYKRDFELYHLVACRHLANTLRKQFDDRNTVYYSIGKLLLILLKIYEFFDPSQIYGLVMGLDYKTMDALDAKDLVHFMQLLISFTGSNISNNEALYERILKICYDYEMFTDGLRFLQQIKPKEAENERFRLYQFLFMTELDRSNEVIKEVEEWRKNVAISSRLWLNLSLLLLINYRKTNKMETCQLIAEEIEAQDVSNHLEYGYFLRLKALYLPRDKGMNSIQKSIEFFEVHEEYIQRSKSQISLSFYLAITGDASKALNAVTQAEAYLGAAHISRHLFENDKAAINLLLAHYGNDVWDSLERAELSANKAFDFLAIANNKLVWCIENRAFDRCDLLVNKIQRLFTFVQDKHMHAFINYNLYLYYNARGNNEAARMHYQKADELKNYCHTLKCRLLRTYTDDHTDFLLTKPWHVCFLTYWCFDLLT